MSVKVKNPNEKSNGFLWALLIVLLLAVALVGYIVVSGKAAKLDNVTSREKTPVSFDVSYKDNAAVLKSSKATDSTPVVDLYEDFSCPACAKLAELTDEKMKKAIEDGKLVVHVRALNFLDHKDPNGHSTMAGNTAQKIAQAGEAENYWNVRESFMTELDAIHGKWNSDDFGKVAKSFGVADDVVAKIEDSNRDEFIKSADENANKLKDAIGEVSSPHVVYNGEDITSENWVETVTGGQ